MNSDFERIFRRLKPGKKRRKLTPRRETELAFTGVSLERPRSFLYDTTVYVDILQGRFSSAGESMLRSADAWHSAVAASELASACALMDPSYPSTPDVVKQIKAVLNPCRGIARSLQTGTCGAQPVSSRVRLLAFREPRSLTVAAS